MKKQIYLCVDVVARMQEGQMKTGKLYKGVLSMTEDHEKFEFDEIAHRRSDRNPTVWAGEHINVHKTKDGRYTIQIRQTELTSRLDPCTFADEVFLDVERAKVELGI